MHSNLSLSPLCLFLNLMPYSGQNKAKLFSVLDNFFFFFDLLEIKTGHVETMGSDITAPQIRVGFGEPIVPQSTTWALQGCNSPM